METVDILSPSFLKNPCLYYETMHEKFPVLYHETTNCYVISRYDDVMKILTDASNAIVSWQFETILGGETMARKEGREHSVHRNIIAPSLKGRELSENVVPVIREVTLSLLKKLNGRTRFDFVGDFAKYLPIEVIGKILGLPADVMPDVYRWYHSMAQFLFDLTGDMEVIGESIKAGEEFETYMIPLIHERREHPQKDLLSILCTAAIDGIQLTDQEIKQFCGILLVGGGETSDKAITALLKNLMEHPGQLQRVKEDRTLVENAIAETIRYSSPVKIVRRSTALDVSLEGGTIPANSRLLCHLGAANRDKSKFKDPDTFDIFRDDLDTARSFTGAAGHLGFGAGRHFCIGAMLARQEITIAINLLLDLLPNVRLAQGATPVVEGLFTEGIQHMEIEFDHPLQLS